MLAQPWQDVWLAGLEEGPTAVGEPHSHGGIRMRHTDVIEWFDQLQIGTRVQIDDE